jgi:hypothetical protein
MQSSECWAARSGSFRARRAAGPPRRRERRSYCQAVAIVCRQRPRRRATAAAGMAVLLLRRAHRCQPRSATGATRRTDSTRASPPAQRAIAFDFAAWSTPYPLESY